MNPTSTFNDFKVAESTDDQHYDLGDYPYYTNKQYRPSHSSIAVLIFFNMEAIIIRKDMRFINT